MTGGRPHKHAELLQSLTSMPLAMRELPQWLLWKFINRPDAKKPPKVPFYVNGELRGWPKGKPKDGLPTDAQPQVEQGADADRAALVSFDEALAALKAKPWMDGVGFAFLPGDGLLGVDIDGAIDPDTGEVSELCTQVLAMCPSFAELSVSGTGVHIILEGHTDKFKCDALGLEVYCDSQYFTCTGRRWAGSPEQVAPVTAEALMVMRAMVDESLERVRLAKEAARQVAGASAPRAPAAPPPAAVTGQGGDDFRLVNDRAMAALHAWVPTLFPAARVHNSTKGQGYRVTSKALGRELQEDLALTPGGIHDFGTERGMTPIDVVVEFGGRTPKDALHWLAPLVGVTLSKPQGPRLVRPAPPDEGVPAARSFAQLAGEPAEDERPEPPLDGEPPLAAEGGEGALVVPIEQAKKRKRRAKPKAPDADADGGDGGGDGGGGGGDIDWPRFHMLREKFALIYGTDNVWDGENRLLMTIANMGHAYGSDMVRLWKGGKYAWRRSEGGRWTVKKENVVFDPTMTADPDTHVNLYGGFPTEPLEGGVGPMLELVQFLVSRAGADAEECDPILHWLLCWLAYPLQNPGAKLRTAVLMYGDEGAGKNFLTDLMVEIYGQYGVTVGQDELEDKFNDWRSCKLFVVGDEVSTRTELAHNKNRLKAVITSPTAQINPKNLTRRTEANHANVMFNSNEQKPLALDNSDRRYLVLWTPKAREYAFYQRLGEWRKEDGARKWLHYLLTYEITNFDLFAPAPITKAKENLIDLNRNSTERFWLEWSTGELDLPYRTCTGEQAYRAFLKYAQRTGDRFPVQRPVFTAGLLRISDSKGSPMQDKVMKVDYGTVDRKEERSTRMLLVCPVPDELPHGQTQGEWATACWKEFEGHLRRFLNRFGGVGEGEVPDA